MVETRQQHQPNANSSSQGPRSPTNSSYVTKSWSQVVASSKRKGNTKKQTVSFNPTLIQRPVSSTEAGQDAINGASSLDPIAVVRPFIKGMEHGSVLIDVTHVKDRSLLNKALLKFNETSDPDFYEDFLGYRKQSRSYLNHDFLETMWTHDSPGRKTVTETGITLEDGTFLRGFPSYPADASIVRVTLENLPFLAASLLKDEIKHRLSCFGEVLDLGITKVDGIFNGEGFATLNLTLDSANPDNECTASHVEGDSCDGLRHLEPLTRVIVWEPRDSEQRKVLLQWDKMPDFCRNCQSNEHCRADCPDYKKWIRCHHCNQTGHVYKNCSRNDRVDSAPSKIQKVERSTVAAKPRKGTKDTAKTTSESLPSTTSVTSVTKSTTTSGAGPAGKVSLDTSSQPMDEVKELPPSVITAIPPHPVSDAEALNTITRDINMRERSASLLERSPVLEPTRVIKKAARMHDSIDISSRRTHTTSTSTASTAAVLSTDHTDLENYLPSSETVLSPAQASPTTPSRQ